MNEPPDTPRRDPSADAPGNFRFSRETDIRLDRHGRFWHEGTRVTHPRLARALASWIDIDPDSGRYILRNAVQWCFFQVEDTPFVVRSARSEPDGFILTLSGGSEEPLDIATLHTRDDVLYCRVKHGRFPARFTSEAATTILDHAEPASGGLELLIGRARHPIADQS